MVDDMRAVVNVRGQSKIAVSKGYIGMTDAAPADEQTPEANEFHKSCSCY